MSARRGALRGVSLAFLLGAAVATFLALGGHESARSEWLAVRARLSTEGGDYDPALSDARYLQVELWRERSGYASAALALALVAFAMASAPPRSEVELAGDTLLRQAKPWRLLAATVVDAVALLIAALALFFARDWTHSLAMRDGLLVIGVAVLVSLPYAALARGWSPGRSALALGRGRAPGTRAAGLAALWCSTLPFALAWSPVSALAIALGRPPSPGWLAPHLLVAR